MTDNIHRPQLPMETPVARCQAGGKVDGVRQVHVTFVVVVEVVAFVTEIGTVVVVVVVVSIVA